MFADIVTAAVIVSLAAILGLTVHPVLWLLVLVAVLAWSPARPRRHPTDLPGTRPQDADRRRAAGTAPSGRHRRPRRPVRHHPA